jgi:DNA-binding SARP family transcriptional activator
MRSCSVALLGGFELRVDGEAVALPLAAQRVVAFLAIQSRPVQRVHAAATLWLETPEVAAGANLRTALWRTGEHRARLIRTSATTMEIQPAVNVDLREATVLARRALDGHTTEAAEAQALAAIGDVLPDWYDDWLVLERESFRQLRLHALDSACEQLTAAGAYADAAQTAVAAIVSEPLRESAHEALIRIHLAEGNRAEAVRQFELYRRLLRNALGIEPSAGIAALVAATLTTNGLPM